MPLGVAVQRLANVRFGSKVDISRCNRHVRFTPGSGHTQCKKKCPVWANSGHRDSMQAISDLLSNAHGQRGWPALKLDRIGSEPVLTDGPFSDPPDKGGCDWIVR
jgi:hypothetical protein